MKTYNFTPIPQLKSFIKNIWIVDCENSNRKEKMIPFGCMDLVYVESKSVLYNGKKNEQFIKNDIFLTGQVTQSYDFEYNSNARIIGFGFYPHTAHCFIQDSAFHFTDSIYHLSDLFNSSELLKTLEHENNIIDKIFLIQQFILNRITKNKTDDRKQEYLHFVLKEIFESKGGFDISKVQNELNISQRYIQLLFKEYVGINPLLYAKVVRFLNAIDSYQNGIKSYTHLALDLGYFDQSHFIRDFKRFTGYTPKNYFNDFPYLIEQFTSNEHSSLLYNSFSDK